MNFQVFSFTKETRAWRVPQPGSAPPNAARRRMQLETVGPEGQEIVEDIHNAFPDDVRRIEEPSPPLPRTQHHATFAT